MCSGHAACADNVRAVTAAPVAAPLTRDQIRAVFLAHGFTVKEGQTDLKDYIYQAAEALLYAATLVAVPLTREQVEDVMTEHYPLDSLLRENVAAFEQCVSHLERTLAARWGVKLEGSE